MTNIIRRASLFLREDPRGTTVAARATVQEPTAPPVSLPDFKGADVAQAAELARKLQELTEAVRSAHDLARHFAPITACTLANIEVPGRRGRIASGIATPTIALHRPADVQLWRVGDVVRASATDGTYGTLRAGSAALTGVDASAGTLTISGNWNAAIGTIANDDFLFRVPSGGSPEFGVVRVEVQHRRMQDPQGFMVVRTRAGSLPPELAIDVDQTDRNRLTFFSTVASVCDLLVW